MSERTVKQLRALDTARFKICQLIKSITIFSNITDTKKKTPVRVPYIPKMYFIGISLFHNLILVYAT